MVGIDWLRCHSEQRLTRRDEGHPLALGHLARKVGGRRSPGRKGRRTGENVSLQLGRLRPSDNLDRLGKI